MHRMQANDCRLQRTICMRLGGWRNRLAGCRQQNAACQLPGVSDTCTAASRGHQGLFGRLNSSVAGSPTTQLVNYLLRQLATGIKMRKDGLTEPFYINSTAIDGGQGQIPADTKRQFEFST